MKKTTRVCLIAEIGMNHNGSMEDARKLIDAAVKAGADTVKFQLHIAEAETLPNAPMPPYFNLEPRYQYFKRTAFNFRQWSQLKKHCERKGAEFLVSPFSVEAVRILEKLKIKRYKIPSGEVTNLAMLEAIAKTKKPILLSSGMSSWKELDQAVRTIKKYNNKLTLLQCTSSYPLAYKEVGLNIMLEMKKRYNLPVGLSDHTMSPFSAFAAVTLGASIIEKHFALSRKMYGSDAKHSLEPVEFSYLAEGVRAIEKILSSPVDKDQIARQMQGMKRIFQKSIVSVVDIPKGTKLNPSMLGIKKPGTGLSPSKFEEVVGRRVARDVPKDTVLKEEDLNA